MFFALQLLALIATPLAYAAAYGDGSYGSSAYGEGDADAAGNNGVPLSPASAPTCDKTSPGNPAPWLYAAVSKTSNSIALYFSDAAEPYDHYAVEYGPQSGHYLFGATNIGGRGARIVIIQALAPDTTYYFRVRAGNGCTTGPWSNELSSRTRAFLPLDALETNITSFEPWDYPEDADRQSPEQGYGIRVRVVDGLEDPVQGAMVELPHGLQTAVTDANGMIVFKNVVAGEHALRVTYNGRRSEQTIYLHGENQTYDITIRMEAPDETSGFPKGIAVIAVGVVVVVALLLVGRRYLTTRR